MENCNKTELELSVNIKKYDQAKGELIDAISAGAKLTKADAGRLLENPALRSVEEFVNLNLDFCGDGKDGECGCPRIAASTHTKLNKAE
jgi:hypothetical protein